MSAWAKPGVKCVCVDAGAGRFEMDDSQLEAGRIYTILEITSEFSVPAVRLVELKAETEDEVGYFHLRRFRPLITKTQEQDVALFTQLLTNIRESEKC